tara:strand:+ start:2827 stop:4434 length:1608 start_codon:yes stop_codon:yes gene_type:complete
MSKEILYGDEARDKLLSGIQSVTNAVSPTLGPKSKTVVLEREYGTPVIINDGVSIARNIELEDKFENLGARLLIEVAAQAQENAGDGTTTASVLANALCEESLKMIKAGCSSTEIKSQFDNCVNLVAEELRNMSSPINSKEEIERIATIASNNDKVIGNLISEAIDAVGEDGVIVVEPSKDLQTRIELVEGMELENGFISHIMAVNQEEMTTEYENPLILTTNFRIMNFQDILPVLELAMQQKRPLLILCADLENTALTNMLLNLVQKTIQATAVKTPDFGEDQIERAIDIKCLVGGKVFDEDSNDDLSQVTIDDLGSADKVIITQDSTKIINGHGTEDKDMLENRIKGIKKRIKLADNNWVEEKLRTRLGKLSGGISVLHVGASTAVEMQDKMERVDDALNATRAAIQEGVVVGGGLALINASKVIKDNYKLTDDVGASIVYRALKRPAIQIAENAGISKYEFELAISNSSIENYGLDASTGVFLNLLEAGIIDPVKVTRSALEAAGSIASMVLTTEVLVAERRDENDNRSELE